MCAGRFHTIHRQSTHVVRMRNLADQDLAPNPKSLLAPLLEGRAQYVTKLTQSIYGKECNQETQLKNPAQWPGFKFECRCLY